ncbi:hypothetical protein [Winogradskya humida]|uniref:Uncharacterized protein n=1 Tax=Winogradskya humida TaxID=113566 RepID=A0ABQ3ZL94_9ACTN|nr:hypothetical protein [Actinoplanes humidus]GIE19268.1 hypothetical protein Ahu01nite_023700 [Actinoplanes humidus]
MGLVVGGSVDAMRKSNAKKLQIKPNTTFWLTDPAHLPQLTPGDDTS